MVEWDGFQNTLDFRFISGSPWLAGNLLRCPELDVVWIPLFMSILLNFLKPLGKIITSVLEIQSSTCMSFGLFVSVLLTGRVVDYFYYCTVELIAEAGTYYYVGKKKDAAFVDEDVGLICWRCDSCLVFETWESRCMFLNTSLALSLFEIRLSWNTRIVLEASGHELHLLQTGRLCWTILDANVVGNAGLLSTTHQLEICTAYLDHWEVYKRFSSFNSQFTWLFISLNQTHVWRLKALELF